MSDVKWDGVRHGFPLGKSMPGVDRAALAAMWAAASGFSLCGAIFGASEWFWPSIIYCVLSALFAILNVVTVNWTPK